MCTLPTPPTKTQNETMHRLSQDTFGVPSTVGAEQRVTYHTSGTEASRLYAKKTIVVGNVSKYVLKLKFCCAVTVYDIISQIHIDIKFINSIASLSSC